MMREPRPCRKTRGGGSARVPRKSRPRGSRRKRVNAITVGLEGVTNKGTPVLSVGIKGSDRRMWEKKNM
ncbi:hypothetical protein EYF80_042646 [Liparis tanakae]|uniref:Uncharacterized protein n=1 Tax=Liparis tanakae TaxID=230148 RepID=A0A4Z2G3M5_9TELE|nr:hypothetical protein EYF80_042646 [Liparis tanakae]